MTRWTTFWYVVYYHCSEFQIFRSLNGLHFSVLSLYPNSVQNRAWFCLDFSDHSKPKQTDVFSHVLYPCHWSIKRGFPQKLTNRWFSPVIIQYISLKCTAVNEFYLMIQMGVAGRVGGNQSASEHGRHTFLSSAMRELVCNEQLWARAALRKLRSYKVG